MVTDDHIKNVKFKTVNNKDSLSACKILLPQRKPKLGRTKPSTGPRVGHSCSKWLLLQYQ